MNRENQVAAKWPIPNQADNRDITYHHQELMNVMDQFYYNVLRVDMRKDEVCILQCAEHPEAVARVFHWPEYLEASSGIFAAEQREMVINNLSSEQLLKVYQSGEKSYSFDVSYLKEGELNCMTCFVVFSDAEGELRAYLMIRNSTREHLRKQIIELYIYKNCDFFIYLDAKNNSYTMFSGDSNNVQLPPVQSDNYMVEMEKYINEFIVPEDRNMAITNMRISSVLKHLEQQEVYSLYYGGMDVARGYVRKRLDYRYYERNTKMLLVSCTDITEMYNQEQSKRQELLDALEIAQTDILTGLLNYKGMMSNVSRALANKPEHAALLFIDVDNFKTVNDTLGHDVGDHVLRRIAFSMKKEAFGEPMVGRVGGDEFVVFFPEINSMNDVFEYAGRVCHTVFKMEYGQKEGTPHISCSIGIVEAPRDGIDYKTLVKKADDMAYQAKFTGKNRYMVYQLEL